MIKETIKRIVKPFAVRVLAAGNYYNDLSTILSRVQNLEKSRSTQNLNTHSSVEDQLIHTSSESLRETINLLSAHNGKITKQNLEIWKMLGNLHKVSSLNYIRMGSKFDGGYPVIDDLSKDDVLISAGLAYDINFEIQASKKVSKVVMLDHTVEDLAVPPGNMIFLKQPLVPNEPKGRGFSLMNLVDSFESEDYVLKVDIEGAEWEIFAESDLDLSKFRQIILEFHGLDFRWSQKHEEFYVPALANILKTHLPIVVHPNNTGRLSWVAGRLVAETVEVLFARKSSYQLTPGFDERISDFLRTNDPNLESISFEDIREALKQ